MKSLKMQSGPFVNDDLLMDIRNGKRKLSPIREMVRHSYIPVAAVAASGLGMAFQKSAPEEFVAPLILAAIGGFAIEGYVLHTKQKEYREQLSKAMLNIQDLIRTLEGYGIKTSIPRILESCVLLTDIVSRTSSYSAEGVTEKHDVKHVEDFVFYDHEEEMHVLRQTNDLKQEGFKTIVDERTLDLLEPTDEEYTKAIGRTRTKIIAR